MIVYSLLTQIQSSEVGLITVAFLIIGLVIIVIILSDFRLLRFGITETIYFWLEYPEKTLTRIQTINEISNIINYNHKAKEYLEETNNSEIKVIGAIENSLILDTRKVFESIKNGLKFTLFFKDMLEYSGETMLIPTQDIAIIEIIHAGELSKGKIIQEFELTNSNKDRLESVKKGELEGINALLKVKLDEDFENSSSEELKTLRELINNIKIGGTK